jgi:hypothetical protein
MFIIGHLLKQNYTIKKYANISYMSLELYLYKSFFTKFAEITGHINFETQLSRNLHENTKLSLGTQVVHVHHCQIQHLDLAPMFQKHS